MVAGRSTRRYTLPMPKPTIDLDELTIEERLDLLDRIWESLSRERDSLPLTDAQRAELDRRLDEMERDSYSGIPLDDVLRSLNKPQ